MSGSKRSIGLAGGGEHVEPSKVPLRVFEARKHLPAEAWLLWESLGGDLRRLSDKDWQMVERAALFANSAHQGQARKSGEPYITHPIEVARSVAKIGLDVEDVCAALLHDVAEDTLVGLAEIESNFGKTVAAMVDALTKIDAIKINQEERKERQAKAETLRKMMLAMSRDVRVILVKLCDRLHNLRTISALDPIRRRRIAAETMEIYAPIASRLGLNNMWSELMTLSFAAQHPWRSAIIEAELDKVHAHHRNYIDSAVARVKNALAKEGIEAEVSGRSKRGYSVYWKMREKKLSFAEVHDKEGLRVIVDGKAKCYMAIGILHELWKPVPGFFKDYIAIPKINGYQSLHTALLNEQGDTMEAQVRTAEMHSRAEDGIASHWVYKSKEDPLLAQDAWLWLQSLLDIQASGSHSDDYLEHVKTDLFSDEVYVFTPSGEVIALPRGASALDLAFGIHSDVGMRSLDATVNGEKAGLSRKLRSGDVVVIQTDLAVQAQPTWLAFAKTGRAKSHIRAYLRSQELPKVVEMGSELLLQALAQLGASEDLMQKDVAWSKASKRFGAGKVELLASVGRGALSSLALAQCLAQGSKSAKGAQGLRPILIGGEESEIVRMGRCCSPMPPQSIIGALSQDLGLVVHRKDCPSIMKTPSKGQFVDLAWEESALSQSFSASIKIKARNERGALGRLAALIASMDGDVNNVRVSGNSVIDDRAIIDFDIQVRSKFHLDRVVDALSKDRAVINVF
jgi:guanosine-3',5'-bis(diphosphate) 3'-pyrophosphohydrolase